MPFYAVKIGKIPGVYNTWTDCEPNIKGVDKAVYKKFNTEQEAYDFFNEGKKKNTVDSKKNAINQIFESVKQTKLEQDLIVKELIEKSNQVVDDNFDLSLVINLHVYGQILDNGLSEFVGSIGIFFDKDNLNNDSKKIISTELDEQNGKKRMELKAILVGLSKIIDQVIETGQTVIVHTDSVYGIKCFTQDLLKNLSNSKQIPNYDYIKKGYQIISQYPQIKFHFVKNINSLKSPGAYGLNKAKSMSINIIKQDIENTVFKFGKYKNNTFAEVYSQDTEYFDWCLLNCESQLNEVKLYLDSKN